MYAYKIVMVGDFGTGKTSLVRRFVDNSFSEDYLSSIGVSISKKLLQNSTMMLWDIEGKTEYKPIFKQYLKGAKGFIIVADLTRSKTIESILSHVELCHELVPNAPICIALNKSDLEVETLCSIQKLQNLSSNIISVLKTSAKSGEVVNEIFELLDKKIIEDLEL